MKKIYNLLAKSLTTLMIPLSSACGALNSIESNMKGGKPESTPSSTSEANSQKRGFRTETFLWSPIQIIQSPPWYFGNTYRPENLSKELLCKDKHS